MQQKEKSSQEDGVRVILLLNERKILGASSTRSFSWNIFNVNLWNTFNVNISKRET